jgi:two-component system, NtrC family, response regulator AtoC
MNRKVLLVDDEEVFVEQLKEALLHAHPTFEINTAGDGIEALDKMSGQSFDIVITDMRMPRMNGMSLLKTINEKHPGTYVVVVTAFGNVSLAVEAMRYGAYDFLEKPFNMETLEIALTKIIRQQEILKENIELKGQIQQHGQGLDQIIGAHPSMQKVYDQIIMAADTDLTVLILGETGTGKELAARSIHHRSPRRGRPFVTINCAAVPENLLESEFFGHEKGAFTGALTQRIGRFEKAHTGTLFLDEIGDIPTGLQAKILRVVQDGRITRLGSNREIELDFRLVCATNRPIQNMIREKLFREDLYYRISVFPIMIPPLRQRTEDIPMLVGHFINKYGKKLNPALKGVTPRAIDELMKYSWPGNVRELENVVQRAIVSAQAGYIEGFPFLFQQEAMDMPGPSHASLHEQEPSGNYHEQKKRLLDNFEYRFMSELLEKHKGVIAEAARESGMNYKTFYIKADELGLIKKKR